MFYFHINRVHRCRTVLYLEGSFYMIKKLVLQCRTEKKCFKAAWISHWFYFKSKDCPISFVWCPKNHLYKEIVPEIFGFLVPFIPCDIGQENGNYELKVIFAIHRFIERKLTIEAFILNISRLNMTITSMIF